MMLVPYPTLLKPQTEKHVIHGVRGVLPTCRMVTIDHGATGHVTHVPHGTGHANHGSHRVKGHRSTRRIQFHSMAHQIERPLATPIKKLPNLGHMPIVFRSPSPTGSPKYSILCYGDSLTAGFCDKGLKFEPYGRTLAKMLGTLLKVPCEVLVCGHSGHTASEMVANMDMATITDVGGQVGKGLRRSLMEVSRPLDLVLLMTGTNDIGKQVEPNLVLEDVIKLHDICKQHGAHQIERPLATPIKKLPNLGHMPIVFRSPSPTGSPKYSILCYGDSLTAGFCDKGLKFEPYGRTLAKMLGTLLKVPCEVLVCGHSGHTASEMVANMDMATITDVGGQVGKGLRRSLMEVSRPLDLVLLMTGTNDIGKQVEPNLVLEDVIKLHDICKQHGVPSVALSPPPVPMDTFTEGMRRRLRDLIAMWSSSASNVHAFVDPGHFIPITCTKSWDADRLHFSPAGSQLLGQQLAQTVLPLLRRGRS